MKKIIICFIIILIITAAFLGKIIYGSSTNFNENNKIVLIQETNTSKENLITFLVQNNIISYPLVFEQIGNQMKIWDRIKSGKYKINKNDNLITIARMFRNNKQAQINLVINKIRLPEDLAKLIGKSFSTDSASAITSLKNTATLSTINADTNTFLFNIIPNTYKFFWSTPTEKIFEKLSVEAKKFWDENDRNRKAFNVGLTPFQVYIIASIVEEETNKEEDKGNIASVYINRLNMGMNLSADPTIKFALKDFALRRILIAHLNVASPYNTYKNKGLPPGPICTPSIKTIDAVLNAPKTDYIFFVAKADFSGYSHFSSNYEEHKQYAKEYQKALTAYLAKKHDSINKK